MTADQVSPVTSDENRKSARFKGHPDIEEFSQDSTEIESDRDEGGHQRPCHKASDMLVNATRHHNVYRKEQSQSTDLGSVENHYSWEQVYHALGVRQRGHD